VSFECDPIGFIRTGMRVKFDAPHQPQDGISERNVVELFPGRRLEQGLKDLEGFERIWLVWWFNRNANWRPLVTPPRGPAIRRGVFATRSPHRPAPIGITAVPLLGISGNQLFVGNTDLLDGTPILDIKPYISSVDSFPNQRAGWLDECRDELDKPVRYAVLLSPLACEQVEWLREQWGIDFFIKARAILEREPQRSRTHRITAPKEGVFRLSSGGWRIFFTVNDDRVTVVRIAPGFPERLLVQEGFDVIPDRQAQVAFGERWADEYGSAGELTS